MCGIFALFNYKFNNYTNCDYDYNIDYINNEFMKGQSRGPECSKLETQYDQMVLGFHRLAINGLNEQSNQPLVINDIVLICNGEIYNYKLLYKYMKIEPITGSDCEVIIYLYIKYGIEQTLTMLDGVYSFILYDNRTTFASTRKVYVARDPFGVRPLYILKNIDVPNTLFGFASELKCLVKFCNDNPLHSINQFQPGTYSIFSFSNSIPDIWSVEKENIVYMMPSFSHNWIECVNTVTGTHRIYNTWVTISRYLNNAVTKRCLTTERQVACLLSGGLDSSLIAALVNNFNKTNGNTHQLETYSIGLEGSEDLKYARIVANYLDTKHTEIIVTETEMFEIIPEVIKAIESYDTTTVRASIGNYLLGKYISTHSEAKVVFNGDGSDELLGGYLYMNMCPDDIEFDKETRRLLKDIHMFDVLRSDKSISSHGLEPRTPFLDKNFVNLILSIPPYFRNHKHYYKFEPNDTCVEKYILRNSFTSYNFVDYNNKQILPDEILWRKKEAFSDGVSSHGRSLYTILQEHICNKLNKDINEKMVGNENNNVFEPNITTEKYYYKMIFEQLYPKCNDVVPYFWMPKYIDSDDPSARTLSIYK